MKQKRKSGHLYLLNQRKYWSRYSCLFSILVGLFFISVCFALFLSGESFPVRLEPIERYLHVEFHMRLRIVVRGKISSKSKPANNNTQRVLDWWIWGFVTDSKYCWMGTGKSYFIAFILNECNQFTMLINISWLVLRKAMENNTNSVDQVKGVSYNNKLLTVTTI